MRFSLALLGALLLCDCRPPPVQLERRVPVDLVADCVALRQRLSECPEEAAEVLLQRRAAQRPELGVEGAAREAARAEVRADLLREAQLPEAERLRQCRLATAETPAPAPEDVARLHRCLQLACARRATCLRSLLLPSALRRTAGALRSPPG